MIKHKNFLYDTETREVFEKLSGDWRLIGKVSQGDLFTVTAEGWTTTFKELEALNELFYLIPITNQPVLS